MSRFLITGGTGFIGRALTIKLRAQNHSVTPLSHTDADLADWEQTRDCVLHLAPEFDYIIHLADVVPHWSGAEAYEQFMQQVAMTENVLTLWRAFQPQARLITMGSLWSYPAACTICSEDQFWNGPLHPLTASYGHGKKLMTVGIETLKRQYGMKGTTLVLGSVYGPGDQSSHVIPTLIRKMKEHPKHLAIQTEGYEYRQFTYIDDQVDLILKHLDYDGELLNIPTHESETIRELVRTLSTLLAYTGKVTYGPPTELPSRRLDRSQASLIGGLSTCRPLYRGLEALLLAEMAQ